MRVCVTGARGLLAAAIIREFSADGHVVALDRTKLDITDRSACERVIAAAQPDIVFNCAAYNDVDGAESDAVSALRINALGVRALRDASRAVGASFVHFGSDFVFDGLAARPYREEDAPNPRAVYAASKLLGDWFALEHPSAYVLRVESLFGEPGPGRARQGSLGTIVARIRAGGPVPVFVDRTVSPTYTADVAGAARELLTRRVPPGLYHCVNSGVATWSEIAAEAARVLGLPIDLKPITLETAALKAPRPKYCALSNEKLRSAGVVMPPWQDALRRYLSPDNSQLPTPNVQGGTFDGAR
jgi:dTDP-4-dehydrorhamnose reductase